MIGIYKIENLINRKIYIGQSRNIKQRWKEHRYRPFNKNSKQYDCPFYRAIRKYGLENFSFVVLEETSIEDLDDKEKYWIKYYGSNNPLFGYNCTIGGESATYTTLTKNQVDEIRNLLTTKISQQDIAKKYNVSQMTISMINTGQTWPDENIVYPIRTASIMLDVPKYVCDKNLIEQKKYYCKMCGSEIASRQARFCQDCAHIMQRKVERPTRNDLKKLIRNNSFKEIGKMYNVSDNTIKKWCKSYQLPHKVSKIKLISDEDWELI